MDSPRVGEYFVCRWGYDQTNLDYCVVREISPSGKTVLCQMVHAIEVEGHMTETGMIPGGRPWGEPFRMHVRDNGRGVVLAGSYPFIPSWPSQRRDGGRFVPVSLGDVLYETRPEFGH